MWISITITHRRHVSNDVSHYSRGHCTAQHCTVLYCTVHVSNDVSAYLIISPGCCGSAVDNAQSQQFMDCHALDEEANDCYNNNYNLPRGIPTSATNRSIGSTTGCTITEKAPTRTFSWLKALSHLRHY